MCADIHDGQELCSTKSRIHERKTNLTNSKASCDARPVHTLGQTFTLQQLNERPLLSAQADQAVTSQGCHEPTFRLMYAGMFWPLQRGKLISIGAPQTYPYGRCPIVARQSSPWTSGPLVFSWGMGFSL
jgi:hypothetical protein